jgi:hypothetical protein
VTICDISAELGIFYNKYQMIFNTICRIEENIDKICPSGHNSAISLSSLIKETVHQAQVFTGSLHFLFAVLV